MSGKLTTHVLDTASGKPAEGIRVELHRIENDGRQAVAETRTNKDGRTEAPLLSAETMQPGLYELTFHVGAYYQINDGFLDTVPLRFRISDPAAHYHVPLLCTPWSYSTYRGS